MELAYLDVCVSHLMEKVAIFIWYEEHPVPYLLVRIHVC